MQPFYQTIIGLEIHLQCSTKSKMFCSCKNDSEKAQPNTNVCPICLGHPGVLPVPNKQAIKSAIKIAQVLNCKILNQIKFDRKNYFYPDLPKAYQISQYDQPIGEKGFLEINNKKIRIRRVHLEEDAAKLLHSETDTKSYIDFNRSGTPLIEIVTEPDLFFSEEAGKLLRELRLTARYLKISLADMEKGHLRCDANVNIGLLAKSDLSKQDIQKSPIIEIKNLNSFKAVEEAIKYEAERLYQDRENWLGKKLGKTTRGWSAVKRKTYALRSKEEAEDYRYFPEPDIYQIEIQQILAEVKKEIPELPNERRVRFQAEYDIKKEDVEIFVNNKSLGDYFEQTASELQEWVGDRKLLPNLYRLASNWILSELQKLLKQKDQTINKCKISPENFAEFIKIVKNKEVNSNSAQVVLQEMFENASDPSQIIQEKGLKQIDNDDELIKNIEKVIQAHQDAVLSFKNGKENALQFLLGQVMRETQGKANPEKVRELLKKRI